MQTTIKQVIAVRTDLNMSVGKMAGQVAHATLGFLRSRFEADAGERFLFAMNETQFVWFSGDHTKILVAAPDEDTLLDLEAEAALRGIDHYLVRDLGKTELPPNTATVLAIGPDLAANLDPFTRKLRLLR